MMASVAYEMPKRNVFRTGFLSSNYFGTMTPAYQSGLILEVIIHRKDGPCSSIYVETRMNHVCFFSVYGSVIFSDWMLRPDQNYYASFPTYMKELVVEVLYGVTPITVDMTRPID